MNSKKFMRYQKKFAKQNMFMNFKNTSPKNLVDSKNVHEILKKIHNVKISMQVKKYFVPFKKMFTSFKNMYMTLHKMLIQ